MGDRVQKPAIFSEKVLPGLVLEGIMGMTFAKEIGQAEVNLRTTACAWNPGPLTKRIR
jgi:hypothetical protein